MMKLLVILLEKLSIKCKFKMALQASYIVAFMHILIKFLLSSIFTVNHASALHMTPARVVV